MAEDQATATLKTSTVEKQPETEPPRVMTTTKRMMVAIDESDSSFYALQWVIDHFSSLLMTTEAAGAEGDLLTVVHVQSPFYHFAAFPAGPGGATAVYASTAMIESVKKAQQETSAALLSRVLQMCRAKQIRAETLVLEGDAKDMICQAVEQMHVDLLVVGSRGLGKIKRAFLGSVSDYCAHHAKCPILIVRPPKEITS
ncbi:hypothetical protein BRARA_C03391 [Brassica rapa]|uniref:UspA domain-containing protein n=2 Tax=Brassica TaxID=3705 RepID=A0A398A0X0_BRACM|nr:universal stress protein PHOS34 isoform X2 [Brassica napus]RID71452.1 hypothetical protein BRARA_C03391 [Brassica rapa]CAF2127230.1 unnamed protein product [Brassica napus]